MKKLLLTFAIMLLPMVVSGHERVLIGSLYYNLNEETKEAEVTSGNRSYSFSEINIPEKVIYNGIEYSVTNICTGAFTNCTNLYSVTIPNSVTSIGADRRYVQGAFWGCTSLTTIDIPNSVKNIGMYTFYNCNNLASITIPNSVIRIGYSAFSGTAWYNEKPDGLVYAGKVAYSYKGTMSETDIIIEEGTVSVSAGAFFNCSGLISAILPNSLKEIGGDYNSYGGGYKGAFTGCSSLISIRIPDSVTIIGDGAFSGCSSLISATIPGSVTFIGDEAFYGCSGLTSVNLSNNLSSIGGNAFKGCSSLLSVTIPNKVTCIKCGTFYGCSSLTSVIIPNSVTTIDGVKYSMSNEDNGAFSGCRSLTNISIPNSVTTIGDCAFRNCSSLSSISIPNSVTSIGKYAFDRCISLLSIDIPNIEISIGHNAFQNCSSLTSIDIPYGIKTIEAGLFMECTNLKSVSLPNSVTKISNLSDNSVVNGAFCGCQSLEKIILPDNLPAIEAETFMNCSKLLSITIPNSVSYIGDRAFYGCTNLTTLTIPNKVASIGEQAFLYCENLITINLSEGIKSFKKGCFAYCENLTNIIIPSSTEAIYQYAFESCNKLEYVKVLSATPPFLYDDSFSNYSVPLKVPKGCKEAYQIAQGWKNFTNISESDKGYYKLVYIVDNEEYKSYKIEEGSTIKPEPAPTKEGYTFSGWSEIPETMPAHDVIVTGTFILNELVLQCAKPTISYLDGQLAFYSETEDVQFVSEIKDTDIKKYYTETVDLSNTYIITVYATKEGYENSDVAIATLCWIEAEPQKEGITDEDAVSEVKAIPVLIQREDNTLSISGSTHNTPIRVYDLSGRLMATVMSNEGGVTRINLPNSDKMLLVEVGGKCVKIGK